METDDSTVIHDDNIIDLYPSLYDHFVTFTDYNPVSLGDYTALEYGTFMAYLGVFMGRFSQQMFHSFQ